ncbi:riboflavin kinase-like [Daphnia pulicaria]|uniref:riboflavin kinase-like n=1 Tax=Daphnia pulicaria TaxID=35523 RepID=UPI001EEBCA89|nr:riboflavin kinase-like [Daphnia pulicaria]
MPTTKTLGCLPFFAKGIVVKGFGRGSKELGIPTANYMSEVVDTLPSDMETGIYYGYAKVDGGPVYKMVMSIGWNPYYKNVKKSMETHILHNFESDFYGSLLKTCIINYIRPEQSYESLDALIDAIKSDIAYADTQLDLPEYSDLQKHSFFSVEKPQDISSGNLTFPGSSL